LLTDLDSYEISHNLYKHTLGSSEAKFTTQVELSHHIDVGQ
jgi:hypothetical protein